MPPRKKEEWISGAEAAAILTENSGHPVSDAYVRLLGKQGKIGMRAKNARENEYNKADVESYRVRRRRKSVSEPEQEAA
jgi:hypothetical protein